MSQELMVAMLNRANTGNELLDILDSLVSEIADETDAQPEM
jgi:hypothetical protein